MYVVSAVDKSGRMADRNVIRAMGWAPGTRVSIRERGGTIAVSPAPDGVHRIDDRGYLLQPVAVRRWCHLAAGDRLLLAADPAAGVLVGHCFAVLDRLIEQLRTQVQVNVVARRNARWLRRTTLTWVERSFGHAVAKAYAGHTDGDNSGATGTYVRARVQEVAAALAALTGEDHPLASDG